MPLLQTRRERAGLIILVLGVAIMLALTPFISGLLGAAVLYVLCIGTYRRLERATNPGIASVVTLMGAVLLIALPLVWILGLVIDRAPEVLRSAQNSPLIARLSELRIGRYDVGAEIARASGTAIQWVSGQVLSFMGSAAFASINIVIAFFGLYYMLHGGPQVWVRFSDYIPFSRRTAEELREHFYRVTRATLLGTALTAAAQGSIIGLGFRLVGLPDALFWGTMTAFASILPVLGSGLVWIPAVLVLVAQGRYGGAVVLGILSWLVASNIDNLIRPLVYRKVSNIHPMITLVGAFAGIRYFGLPGLLLGPLAIAYFFELLRFYRQEYGPPDTPSADAPAAPEDAPATTSV
jgi:predicted PurR-regulated permease PerM